MTPADLRAWLGCMGFTQQQGAEEMGLQRDAIARMLAGTRPIELRTALACAALAKGLGPWAPGREKAPAKAAKPNP